MSTASLEKYGGRQEEEKASRCDIKRDDLSGIALFVANHLPQWKGTDLKQVMAEDVSGYGMGFTFKVVCGSSEPRTVCFKLRARNAGSPSERCISLGATCLSARGVAPKQLAAGANWWIENWGGVDLSKSDLFDWKDVSVVCAGRCGELLALIHATPTRWYDKDPVLQDQLFKEIEDRVGQKVVREGHLGWFVRLLGPWFPGDVTDDGLKEMCVEWPELIAPHSAAGKRRVTAHGDFHCANILLTPNDDLKVVDFDFVGVSLAVFDVAYFLQHAIESHPGLGGLEKSRGAARRAFVSAYLEASALPNKSEDVTALVVDAEVYRLGMCIRCPLYAMLPRGFMRLSSDLCKESKDAYRDFVRRLRQSPQLQEEVVALGIYGCINQNAPELVALQKRAQARLCVADSGFSTDFSSGNVPYWNGLPA